MSGMRMHAAPMIPSAPMALMTAAMMVAMMLPSIAPVLWRCRRDLADVHAPDIGRYIMVFAAGYVSVWTMISLALLALSAGLPLGESSSAMSPHSRWIAASIVLCAGMLQRSRWKARRLLRCRTTCADASADSRTLAAAWRAGRRLGIDCGASCAAPMAVLFVAGLMDSTMMLVITAAITVERLAPSGARIARVTGALAIVGGLALWVQAI